jgi:CubicO group peptidase (beta-lactamase class C family)
VSDVDSPHTTKGESTMTETTTVAGTVAPGWEPIREAFARGHVDDPGGAQLCVYRHGEPVVDLWTLPDSDRGDFTGDTLSVIFSATKGALAVCAAMLVDRGLLDVDAPVARYWPEFAVNGKEQTTTAHFLTHTAGLPGFPSASGIRSADYGDRDRCIRALEEAAPLWHPGATRGTYHAVTYGFLVSEVLRRVTGMTEGDFLAAEIAGPLGLDFWIGLPAELEPRVWPHTIWMTPSTSTPTPTRQAWADAGVDVDDPVVVELLAQAELMGDVISYLDTRDGHAAQIPASNGITNARGLARMYAATIGEVDGVRLLSPEAVEFFRTSRTRRLPPVPALAPLGAGGEMGLGFAIADPPGAVFRGMPIPGSFGHSGAGGVHGLANPARGIAAGYTCTSMHADISRADPRLAWADAVLDLVPDPA